MTNPEPEAATNSLQALEELADLANKAAAQAFDAIQGRLGDAPSRTEVALWLSGLAFYAYWILSGEGEFSGPGASTYYDRFIELAIPWRDVNAGPFLSDADRQAFADQLLVVWDVAAKLGDQLTRPRLSATLREIYGWDADTAVLGYDAARLVAAQAMHDSPP
jgi:hypothetical protein